MEKFVKTVNFMDETILVPCRLMDLTVSTLFVIFFSFFLSSPHFNKGEPFAQPTLRMWAIGHIDQIHHKPELFKRLIHTMIRMKNELWFALRYNQKEWAREWIHGNQFYFFFSIHQFHFLNENKSRIFVSFIRSLHCSTLSIQESNGGFFQG